MNPDRLRQIEELFHSVCESSSERRALLFSQVEAELRSEVESLLAHKDDGLPSLDVLMVTSMQPGTRLGPYEIESKLGEGGMSEVFRAADTRLGRLVAIKIVDQDFSARFEHEARAISALNHPNVCTLFDIGPNYLVMELLEGETVAARLQQGPLETAQALLYGKQIAAALSHAHQNGIVHGDLKPGNVMLTKSGAKVLDFGLATADGEEVLTNCRTAMGTPAYMAPEQREGKRSDARTDIYSFGLVLYEMLIGQRATANRQALPSSALERIVARCLETDPEHRWQSTAELVRALDAASLSNSRKPKNISVWMIAGIAVLAIALMAAYFVSRSARKLMEQDTIVLADFTNNTGDPVFDGTLRQALTIQLEQSPFLKIMDDAQVQQDLRLMRLPPGTRVTNQIAHDICVRDAGAAILDGAVASLGKSYVLTLQAISCHDGAALAREQIQARDKEHVLAALGTAATAMRAKLGESRGSIQKLNRPLEQVTTSSLEALQNFTEGYVEWSRGRFLAARQSFERAIALDANFAMAYVGLSAVYGNAGDAGRESDLEQKAFALIDRVSEYEREMIAARYYEASGDLDKAVDAYRLGIGNYPRRWLFHNNLSETQISLGQFEDGLQEGQSAVQLQPNSEPPYRRLLDAYLCLDRLEDAKRVAASARVHGIDGARIHQRFLEVAFVEGDHAAIAKETQWYAGKPEEYLSVALQAANLNVLGQRRESSRLYQRAAEMALRRGLREVAAGFEEANARADALSGNCRTARHLGGPALALALCNDVITAEKVAAAKSRISPNGTIWNAVTLSGIHAAIALSRDQPAEAVQLLASASAYECAYPEAVYLRGLAYLHWGKGSQASAEFQKVLDHKGASWGSTWKYPNWGLYYSVSYLGLARAAVLMGNITKAQKGFQDIFALWKDADQDLPILVQARKEYAALH